MVVKMNSEGNLYLLRSWLLTPHDDLGSFSSIILSQCGHNMSYLHGERSSPENGGAGMTQPNDGSHALN